MPEREHESAPSGWQRELAGTPNNAPAVPDDGEAIPKSASDEELMLAFCGGDAASFEALFRRYQQPVFGFFRRRMLDPTRAEELTQECFLAVLRAAERYRPEASFRTFLYAVALNLLRADRRKAAFRALWNVDPEEESAEFADPRGGADAGLVLHDALSRLDAHDREVLMLRAYEELSYAELAEVLRMPVNTVRSRLFRARTALRTLLTKKRVEKPARAEARDQGTDIKGKERA